MFESAHAAQNRQELRARELVAFVDSGCYTIPKDGVARAGQPDEFRTPQSEMVAFRLVDKFVTFLRRLSARWICSLRPYQAKH